jgi:ABC-type multidrug transport system fused ATPase/permease subunit
VSSGRILLDGRDIRSLDPAWLHRNIGLVSQEPVLFCTSIRQNLTYGVETASDEDIMRACEMANAADFIRMFPEGFDTLVGERGVRLSGGQKQRVASASLHTHSHFALLSPCAVLSSDRSCAAVCCAV